MLWIMRGKILILVSLVLLFSRCTTNIVEDTVESYPDGTPKIVRYYKDDGTNRMLFKETLYYSNHQKYMEGEYKDGKRNGKWTSWFQNGKEMSIHHFIDGIDDGDLTVFYENGEKRYEGKYTSGKKVGVWRFWDENGKLQNKEDYNE